MRRPGAHRRGTTTVLVACILAAVAGGCTRDASSGDGAVAVDQTATTTVPSSTTVPWVEGEEIAAWEKFVESYATIDVSEVSTGECGPRAMMVTEESLTMYWWDGERWNDDSQLLAGGKGRFPLKVYTHDYTNDGVKDFFVLYADEARPRTQTYGAFFAYPWAIEEVCKWDWVDVDNGRTTTKTLASPDVNVQKGRIYGPGFTRRRTSARGVYEYLPSTDSFMYRELVKE